MFFLGTVTVTISLPVCVCVCVCVCPNLRAVLTLLLYIRKRHPPFWWHRTQHGSASPGDAAGDGGQGGRQASVRVCLNQRDLGPKAEGPRTIRSQPVRRNSERVTQSEPRKWQAGSMGICSASALFTSAMGQQCWEVKGQRRIETQIDD